jgi:hypothetical protein
MVVFIGWYKRSDFSHQDENNYDNQHKAKAARGAVAPTPAVTPCWKCPDEEEDEEDEEDGS